MARIVAALAMVHNPFITGIPDAADPDQAHQVHAAYSSDLVLDHGTMVPLHFLTPRLDLPIVHVHQATSRGPRPPLKRCYELGRILRQVIEARPASERVAVIGTGGLSHWVGGPRMGDVNAE